MSLGRRLRSVALRYQSPVRDWPPVPCRGGQKWLLQTTISEPPSASAAVSQSRSRRLANLEAAFFLAREPQGSRRMAQLTGLADGTKARTLVRTLNRLYDAEGCAFRVEEVAGGLQLMSRPKFAPWLRRLHAVPVEVRLSGPAMETLAVVAYRQPVLRAEIEAIRGVQCGELLRQLMDRDLVRIVGRSEELGRPFLYGTTRRFLQIFGLRHLEELPRPDLFCRKKNAAENPLDLNRDASGSDKGMFIHPDKFSQKQEATVKAPATMDLPARLPEQAPLTVIPLAQGEQLELAAKHFESATQTRTTPTNRSKTMRTTSTKMRTTTKMRTRMTTSTTRTSKTTSGKRLKTTRMTSTKMRTKTRTRTKTGTTKTGMTTTTMMMKTSSKTTMSNSSSLRLFRALLRQRLSILELEQPCQRVQ